MSTFSQLLSWVIKRYVRFVVLGAVAFCAMVNLAIHAGAGVNYICEEECTADLMSRRLSPMNKMLLNYIRDNLIDPAAPQNSFKADYDIKHPPWSKLGRWGDSHDFVMKYFSNYDKPGRFVEIGAQDGEFMSLTLHLEEKGFEGLLVEPNPRDYLKLRAKKRSSRSINACVSPSGIVEKTPLWLRHNSGRLPALLNRVQEGSNRLFTYVAKEDRDLGEQVMVQCFPLITIVQAAFRILQVDLVTISTHGGELDILSTIPKQFLIRMLVIMAPMAGDDEMKFMKQNTEERNLTMIYSKSNMHIFLPASEVKIG